MQPLPTESAADQASSASLFGRRRALAYAGAGLVAYALALVANLPARFAIAPTADRAVAGTVWNGEAVLDGGYRLEWHWAPWRSLTALAFAADIRLSGTGTDVAGSATARGDRLVLTGLSGRGDGALLSTLAPGLPFACDTTLSIDIARLVLDGARSAGTGEVRSDGGSCTVTGVDGAAPIPPLLLRASRIGEGDRADTRLELAPVGRDRLHLLEGAISGGRLVLATTPAGGRALPFAHGFRIDRPL